MTISRLILKTLVGSRAYGIAREDSDYDYRGVFQVPTSEIVGLNSFTKNKQWIEGNTDEAYFELGHFLHLAVKSNPSIMDIFVAPILQSDNGGRELRNLFPHVWSAEAVQNAWLGKAKHQQTKMLDPKQKRVWKFAAEYLRLALTASNLLTFGYYDLEIRRTYRPLEHLGGTFAKADFRQLMLDIKDGKMKVGEIVDLTEQAIQEVKRLAVEGPYKDQRSDEERINEFLVAARKEYF